MTSLFTSKAKIYCASAPGRMDVMGGVADYSGSLLLQMPIREQVTVRLQKRNDAIFHCQTKVGDEIKNFMLPVSSISGKTPGEIPLIFNQVHDTHWAAYVIGCFIILFRQKKFTCEGASIVIDSTVPLGKGVSSSAALEVAVMKAICNAYHISLGKTELPLLCQQVENEIAGAPCGLMDQLSVYLGKKNKLLPIICQPHQVFEPLSIPANVFFAGIDSGIRHAVGGSSYSDVRTAAFMGYTMIAMNEGASIKALESARNRKQFDHLPYNGYLANISPSIFAERHLHLLPDVLRGSEFLERYSLIIDTATEVDPVKFYRVRSCALHPVLENFRIALFQTLLLQKQEKKINAHLLLMGELMYQSHMGYSEIGLGNETTNEIVDMAREKGPLSGVFGARITGGGSGGTVCILARGRKGRESIKEIHAALESRYGKKLNLFRGSSNGALTLK